jgi:hypothetical protein
VAEAVDQVVSGRQEELLSAVLDEGAAHDETVLLEIERSGTSLFD